MPQDELTRGLIQLKVFGRKNVTLALRNWKGSLGQLVSPIVIVFFLFGIQLLADAILNRSTPNPIPIPIGKYPKCQQRNEVACQTIIYAPADVEWVNQLLMTVATKSGLDFNSTFTGYSTNSSDPFAKFAGDNSTIYTHLLNHPNATQHALIFTSAYVPIDPFDNSSIYSDVGYILFYNATLQYDYALEVMRVLDESILQLKGMGNASITAELNTFPVPKARVSGYDSVAANGGVWFYVPSMITFFILLTEIVMEKEQRLRLGMRMMGLMDSVYWTIYFLTGLAFVVLTTLVLIVTGYIFQFDFFLKSNFFAIFFMFVSFGMATNTLAFFLSTFVGAAKTAQTMGYAIILVGFVFQIILCSGYGILVDMLYGEDIATWVKFIRWILTFYPPFNFAVAFNNVSYFSSNTINIADGTITPGVGYHWSTMTTERKLSMFNMNMIVPSNARLCGLMVMNAFIFLILALYFDNVIPGDHGSPKPFHFFLTPKYWGFGAKRSNIQTNGVASSKGDNDVNQEAQRAAAALMARSPTGVQVLNLCKTYPNSIFRSSNNDVKAVDNLSLSAEEGDILCILGHNGAGKTTTINMLVGLFPPTSGVAVVYGKDVTQEMSQIQRYMGVCPQHDILWNELTAREHLLIFAELKGVPAHRVNSEISEKLEMVGLTKNENHRVGTYSGGMKRRLSVAIAAIGEPKIIFLDEPTTGMDPVNRRSVWELIQKMKAGRVIVLTTHSMEEADVLGDKISIMAHGNLCAVGNSLHLKNRYGMGYRVNVTASEVRNKKVIINDVKLTVPEAAVLASNAGNLTFGVPLACIDKMEPLLKYLEAKSTHEQGRVKPLVKEWGLSHTTLEDVFLEVTKRENFTYPEEAHRDDPLVPSDEIEVGTEKDFARQNVKVDSKRTSFAFRALIRKNFSLQKRQTGTNICQIVTPILVMAILVLLQVIIKTQIGDDLPTTLINTFPMPLNTELNLNSSILPIPPSPTPLTRSLRNNPYYFRTGFTQLDSLVGNVLESMLKPGKKPVQHFASDFSEFSKPSLRQTGPLFPKANNNTNNSTSNSTADCLEFFFFTKPNAESDAYVIGELPSNATTTKSGFLGLIPQRECLLYNNTVKASVPYYEQKPDPQTMTKDVYDILTSYNKISLEDLKRGPYNYPLPDGIVQFNSANDEGEVNYVMAVNDNQLIRYHRRNNFTRLGLEGSAEAYSIDDTLIIVPGRLALMSMLHDAFRQYLTNVTYSIFNTKFIQLMPYKSEQDIVGLMEFFGAFLYPIALCLQLPVYLYVLVLEKAEKIREMMGMHGLPRWTYYLSHYIFCFILFMFVIVFFYVVGALTEIRLFRQTNFFVLFFFFFAWGNALICISMLFSTFISSKRASVVVGYLVALLGSLIAIVISIGIYNDTTEHMPIAYFIWPQFAFVRGLYLMNSACTTNYQCYIFPVPHGDEYITCIIALFVDSVVYYLVYLYLDQVMPREFGVPKHPLFFLGPIINRAVWDPNEESAALLTKDKEPLMRTFHDNPDVDNEKSRVRNRNYQRDAPLVIEDLSKKYPGAEKYSLRGLYLAVESGECFSLLGENGAGKSTAISLLTGLYPPTHGTAAIAGHDITREMDQARLALGVCPQFNVLWDTLTVEEHLLFYARLKGVSPKDEKSHVREWLIELGLTFAAERPSASLSGGMKRRVSVGIALVGNPRVVFLDEPTTGLDPASRRHLWTILEKARPGRAIILTTHSMDEAEVLSNRIGIMALGTMRCIGTPHHLKNSIGNLFHLKINFMAQHIKPAEGFVYNLFPKAQLIRSYKGTSEFHISQEGVLVSEVFAKMESSSKENMIMDWSFSQVGLEEVFQMVVEDSHNN